MAQLHFVVGRQFAFSLYGKAVEARAVQAVKVAQAPTTSVVADFRVFQTAANHL